MKPTETGSFRIDDEHMKRKKDEDMKKKKEQEWVEKKKLYRRRGKLLWGQFFVAFIILGWFISGGIIYLANLGHDNKKDLIIVCVAGPLYLIIIVVIVWLIFSEAILPAFRNVKSDW